MKHSGGRNRPFSYRYREGYVDMKLIENPTAGRPLLFFSLLIIDQGQRNENIEKRQVHIKQGRCKYRKI
jgi:hypothetical protein